MSAKSKPPPVLGRKVAQAKAQEMRLRAALYEVLAVAADQDADPGPALDRIQQIASCAVATRGNEEEPND